MIPESAKRFSENRERSIAGKERGLAGVLILDGAQGEGGGHLMADAWTIGQFGAADIAAVQGTRGRAQVVPRG